MSSVQSVDELLVSELRKISKNVYHLEVYQDSTNTNQINYPCFVYARRDFDPWTELAGESGMEESKFEVLAIALDSGDLRKLADGLVATYKYAFLQALQALKPFVVDWEVTSDSESIEFAMELQSKGYKISSMLVRIVIDTNTGEPCPNL